MLGRSHFFEAKLFNTCHDTPQLCQLVSASFVRKNYIKIKNMRKFSLSNDFSQLLGKFSTHGDFDSDHLPMKFEI